MSTSANDIANRFQLDGELKYCGPYGSGHINETYLLVDTTAREYILQRINKKVFTDPVSLMGNIAAVTKHIRKKIGNHRETMSVVPAKDGEAYIQDDEGEFWRMYDFITDSICLQQAGSIEDFRESAAAFGRFQAQLADFPAHELSETIPRFHDTPNRYEQFHQALSADALNRAGNVKEEIAFALEREAYASTLQDALKGGLLPLRVTHNDTKLNNVLFDRITRKALCVIDLDTVMPGLSVNDFGDSIRFGASTAAEDERELDKVRLSLELFRAYTEGFLSACAQGLTAAETAHLCDGAKMMTLECGVRFLTDYLAGDAYFRVSRPEHNLDRCRTQFKLVGDMEAKWSQMQKCVEEALAGSKFPR